MSVRNLVAVLPFGGSVNGSMPTLVPCTELVHVLTTPSLKRVILTNARDWVSKLAGHEKHDTTVVSLALGVAEYGGSLFSAKQEAVVHAFARVGVEMPTGLKFN